MSRIGSGLPPFHPPTRSIIKRVIREPGLLNDQVSLVGFVLPADTYMVMVA